MPLLPDMLEGKHRAAGSLSGLTERRIALGVGSVAIDVGQLGRVAEGVAMVEMGYSRAALARTSFKTV